MKRFDKINSLNEVLISNGELQLQEYMDILYVVLLRWDHDLAGSRQCCCAVESLNYVLLETTRIYFYRFSWTENKNTDYPASLEAFLSRIAFNWRVFLVSDTVVPLMSRAVMIEWILQQESFVYVVLV